MENNIIQNHLKELKEDNQSGASEFIDKALNVIELQLEQFKESDRDHKEKFMYLFEKIIKSRPSMAPLSNIVGFLVKDLGSFSKKNISKKIKDLQKYRQIKRTKIEESFSKFLEENKHQIKTIMTISYSSSVVNQLLKHKDLDFELYVLESRPLFEGRRVAEVLSKYFQTNLIIDAAMGYFINKVDLVLYGADSILKDGSIINKIGTHPLSVIANDYNVKTYALTDSFKFNIRSYYDKAIKIEEKSSKEVFEKNVEYKVLNYYFDITPPKYITGIISDLGVLGVDKFLEKVRENLPLDWMQQFKSLL